MVCVNGEMLSGATGGEFGRSYYLFGPERATQTLLKGTTTWRN